MDLTVAICTFRRHEPLRLTLASLAECAPIAAAWELVVVDNGCDEAVRRIVEPFADRLPVRYEIEKTLGTSHARNRAVALAKAPVVLFTDDDVTFDNGWLLRMWGAIQTHPECAFWGGRVEPVWEGEVPRWFDPDRCASLGDTIVQYRRGEKARAWDAASDPPFYTANLGFRVEKIIEAGGFDTTVGHRGAIRVGAEDSLMVHAIASRGGRGWYAADAVVYHPVPSERATRAYARRFAWRQGRLGLQVLRQRGEAANGLPRWVYRVAAEETLRGGLQWARGAATLNPAESFAGQYRALFNLSKLWHAMRS